MPSASIVYYTDHHLPLDLAHTCRRQLLRAADGTEIVTVALNKPAGFGAMITLAAERGILTMHRQILIGLDRAAGDYVFMCEHDVYYHASHFSFVPPRDDTFYYNVNVIHARWPDGFAVYWDNCQQVSGLCASRALLTDYYTARIAQIERDGFNRHYEPGLKQTVGGRRVENWQSESPNLDIRHDKNLTPSKWRPSHFRNPSNARGWRELGTAPGWSDVVKG